MFIVNNKNDRKKSVINSSLLKSSLYSSATVLLLFSLFSNNAEAALDAYITKLSASPGEQFSLLVNSTSVDYQYQIVKYGKIPTVVFSSPKIVAVKQIIPTVDAWKTNLNWASPQTIVIPAQWKSGIYQIKIQSGIETTLVDFRVKEKKPGSSSRILMFDNSMTNIAYNFWGGKSLYDYNSTGARAHHLSLYRPNPFQSQPEELEFVCWAEHNNIPLEHASMLDLHQNPDLLNNYNTIIFLGHSEYWSREMRDNYDQFVATGGNALIMGGNTMWWQIRIENGQLVGYKDNLDPIINTDPSRATLLWLNSIVNLPENKSTGVSFLEGGYVNSTGFYMAVDGYGGYTVTDQNHWVFTGTGLLNGDVFGQQETIAGYEVDGVDFIWLNGVPVLTGNDGAPSNFKILAYSPAATAGWAGNGTMGVFQFKNTPKNGGTVVNTATIDWADGLWNIISNTPIANTHVSQITKNILNQFNATGLPPYPDFDGDGIYDDTDNCKNNSNPAQVDTDKDGYGNLCDADFDNNGLVNSLDLSTFKTKFLTSDPNVDLNSDGVVNSLDLSIFKPLFFKAPGPAAIDFIKP